MATEIAYPAGHHPIGIVADGVFDAYLFVAYDRRVAGANAAVAGIALMPSEKAGDHVTVAVSGVLPVKAGSDAATNNLTPGTLVKSAAGGKVIKASADTDVIVGRIWVDSPTATAENQLVLVHLRPEGRIASS